ncbi:inactive leucine-rich repeat receptor-like protein kinase CORYNE, partial [Tanacetum coccineum]
EVTSSVRSYNISTEANASSVSKLTKAAVHWTTLGILIIGVILSAKAKMYDTMSLLHPYLMSMRLNIEEQKMVNYERNYVLERIELRCIFRYIKTNPILNGPVVFSSHISPKSLESLYNDHLQLLGGNYYMILNASLSLKKLHPFQIHKHKKTVKRRVQKDLEILTTLKHRHLMSLKAYVHQPPDKFCLVYDYVSTDSLEDAMNRMRGDKLQLGWDVRLKTAVGIINELKYIHFMCTPSNLHYNLKPSNVLLDVDFEPRLTQFAARHTLHFAGHTSAFVPRDMGHRSLYIHKSDIFSFWVILGILLTGKDPSGAIFKGNGSGSGSNSTSDMGMWFRQIVEVGDGRDALDKSILGEDMEEDEMLMAIRIAAVCLSDMPADRPFSDELVSMLTQLNSF